jgi:hypothetical protein
MQRRLHPLQWIRLRCVSISYTLVWYWKTYQKASDCDLDYQHINYRGQITLKQRFEARLIPTEAFTLSVKSAAK